MKNRTKPQNDIPIVWRIAILIVGLALLAAIASYQDGLCQKKYGSTAMLLDMATGQCQVGDKVKPY